MANANPKLERMGSGWLLRMQSQGELEGDIMAKKPHKILAFWNCSERNWLAVTKV